MAGRHPPVASPRRAHAQRGLRPVTHSECPRRGPGRRADCTYRPAAGQPGREGGVEREGNASVARGDGGMCLSLQPTWDSRFSPSCKRQFPGCATLRTGTETARALVILFCLFPARSAASARPSSKPTGFLRAEERPFSAPPRPYTIKRDRREFSREFLPLPQPVSARTGKEEGAPGESAADAIILCFSAVPTSTFCLRPARVQPYR